MVGNPLPAQMAHKTLEDKRNKEKIMIKQFLNELPRKRAERRHSRATVIESAESPMFIGLSRIIDETERMRAVERLILNVK